MVWVITMKLTPEERRCRIYELMEMDVEYSRMKTEYEHGKTWFEKHVSKFPKMLRNKFWSYPGMGYFIHHRMLTIICRNMKFIDEE